MKRLDKNMKAILLLIGMVVFTIPTFATIYEDAEDNATTGWVIEGNTTDATVENVEDTERGSRVIELTGNGKNTEYHLGNLGGRDSYIGAWKNKVERQLQWSMKYNESFMVIVSLLTKKGNKYLVYTNQSEDNKGKIRGGKVRYGLGADSANGEWHTFTRDLEADWNAFMPDEPFVSVNGFFIRGSGRVDDISLIKHIYEDAEDNATTGWISYGDTADATIENVEDVERGSRVIKLTGNGKNTGFRLGNRAGRVSDIGAWNNRAEKVLTWSMKYNEPFRIYIPITTEHGNRFLTYTNQSVDKKGKVRGEKVHYGLGEDSINGEWHTFTRDLKADWNAFMPDDPFVAVNGFFIKGSGYVDDIKSLNHLNPNVPSISLIGYPIITLDIGDKYIDKGATTTDAVDGNIQTTGLPIDTSKEGNHTVIYSVSDSSGNLVHELTREVRVVPFKYIDTNDSLQVENVTAIPTFESVGITVNSNYDDDMDSNCTIKYKEKDSNEWKLGLPLRLVQSEKIKEKKEKNDGDIEGTGDIKDSRWHTEKIYNTYVKNYDNKYKLYIEKRHYRGSLVNLRPNTDYEYELNITDPDGINGQENTSLILTGNFKTWNESFKVGQTIAIHAEDLNLTKKYNDSYEMNSIPTAAYTITDSGSEEKGYIVYTFPEIDVDNNRSVGIFIDNGVHHVIIKGATIKNASVHGIMIGTKGGKAIHDIVIEDSNISGWGREANKTEVNRYCENPEDGQLNWSPEWGKNSDSGIFFANYGAKRVIIQRNEIHDPRYRSNSWLEQYGCNKYTHTHRYHPSGPKGIGFGDTTGGNHVIRYNHIHANENNHNFNDIMGGTNNQSPNGFPRNDTDIYGNILEDGWDDAIEAEGRNENCRIWGNFIKDSYKAIATRWTVFGPIYIWRNVVIVGKRGIDEDGIKVSDAGFHKSGGKNGKYDEGVYVFHNTVRLPDEIVDYSKTTGIAGSMANTIAKNNILLVSRPIVSEEANKKKHEKNYFLNNFTPEVWNSSNVKKYSEDFTEIKDNGENDTIDNGLFIDNFNDNYEGEAPDLGAHEADTPPMEFGPNAYID